MTIEIKDTRGMRVMLLGDTHPVGRPELWSIHIEPTGDNLERLCLGGNFPRAEVLAALGAVDKVDVIAAERAADEIKAKLAEAEATIERVKALTECGAHTLTRETIRAALEPKPTFELPTEAGVRFTAIHTASGHREKFTTITDGSTAYYLVPVAMTLWTGARVMSSEFTDHRLLDGEA